VKSRVATALFLGFALVLGACGSKTGLGIPEPTPDDASMDAPVDTRIDVPIDVPVDVPECTVFGASAELLPLDVFMLFDASGSMQEPTETGITKWQATRRAIRRFFRDPESEGIGVALTFFPQVQEDVPLLCDDDRACMRRDACIPAQACRDAGVLCNTVTDCELRGFPGDACLALGYCAGLGMMDSSCSLDGTFPCSAGTGPCVRVGVCDNRDNCDVVDYRTPAIGIQRLNDGASALLSTYDAHELTRDEAGGTPTLPAVRGVVEGAVEWARDNPTHKVVVVVATDGFPTSCDPDLRLGFERGVDNLAAVAQMGVEAGSVQTFVIGVFGPGEREFAQTHLDRIAVAGETGAAYIVETGSETTDELLNALNQVRLDATACDFALSEPIPLTGEPVFARITRDGRETWLADVGGPEGCGGGGYYVPEPMPELVRIALCPESCALLGASPDRELEILTTCPDDPIGP
jgi:hypothetical protein